MESKIGFDKLQMGGSVLDAVYLASYNARQLAIVQNNSSAK